ncbi:hypothetical protein N7488_003334 [Penicillium malachiteum]|nr:hypothetical protein N7488_003334 [Penicillium malachiteum]
MSYVASSRSGSRRLADPTIALSEALTRFDTILTEEQKRIYKASATKPDATSVIDLVTEIDANDKNTLRRCAAPRLHTFLEATQQFSDVVGTFVSANPVIAALFDKVTNMIMEIGKACPTYKKFGQLYPDYVDLQRALCDYFAIIVRLCIKIIEVSRRPLITQSLSSIFNPFESDFKGFRDQLDQAATHIQLQISLASAQADNETRKLLELESQRNAGFRKLTARFQKESQDKDMEAKQWRIRKMKRETADLKFRIRTNLSTVNHVRPWKQAMKQRAPRTAEWILREACFQEWKRNQSTAILWCSGTMGSGKSVLMSNVISELYAEQNSNHIISYYFCRADDSESLSARKIIGSIARQILDSQIEQSQDENLQDLYKDSCSLDTADIIDFVLPQLQFNKEYYLLIDGLDECEAFEVRQVVRGVAQLYHARGSGVKVLYSGRPELEMQLFRDMKPKYRISISQSKIGFEMDCFIDTTLRLCLKEGRLKVGNPKLVLDISESLSQGSNGMFLWTRLFIEELCVQGSDSEIIEALKHPPRGLAEIFDRKLTRVRTRTTGSNAIRVLKFCGVMKRPLTAMEYQEVLGIFPGQKSLERGKLPNDVDKILSDCCGLISIDEGESTVHYVHHSVKQHLFATDSPRSEEFNFQKLDWHAGVLCMTYLDFSDFKRQLSNARPSSKTLIQPLRLGLPSFVGHGNVATRMALKLLSSRHQLRQISASELERKAQEVLGHDELSRLDLELQTRGFQFMEYARNYWLYHLTNPIADLEDSVWKLFCRCMEGNDILAYKPWESAKEIDQDGNDVPRPIRWLLAHGHYPLLLYYLTYQARFTERFEQHILEKSIIDYHYRLADCIIQHRTTSYSLLQHGLFCASREGCHDLLGVFFRVVANPDARVSDQTPLQAAAGRGHLEVVERLLAAKADVNAPAGGSNGRTALQAAASGGHLEVVERLLVAKANVNTPAGGSNGRTALQAAASGGHLDVVERLLVAKANVNTPAGFRGRTALQAAASGGHLDVVERLLAATADVNAPAGDQYGRTALQAAASGGHLEVVERLLVAKADVNAPAGFDGTALQAAASGGHLDVVERLLAAKADVNAPAGFDGRTALQAAASGGHLDVVDRLKRAGAFESF